MSSCIRQGGEFAYFCMQVTLITTYEKKPLAIFFVLRELFEISRKIPVPEKGIVPSLLLLLLLLLFCIIIYLFFFSGLSRESGKVRRRAQINRLFC